MQATFAEVNTQAKPVDASAANTLSGVSQDGTVVFSGAPSSIQALKAGDVLVCPPVSAAPAGLLRRVLSASNSGGTVTLSTQQAKLEDALTNGSAKGIFPLSPNAVASAVALRDGVSFSGGRPETTGFFLSINDVVLFDADGSASTTGDQVKANGSVTLSPTLTLELEINGARVKNLTAILDKGIVADLRIDAPFASQSIDGEVELARWTLQSVTLWLGPVPVVVEPVLALVAGVSGEVSVSATTSITLDATLKDGMVYDQGTWAPVTDLQHDFGWQLPTVGANADVKGYIAPRFSALLYGLAGPYMNMEVPYLELDADTASTPWWDLYGGAELGGGLKEDLQVLNLPAWQFPSPVAFRYLVAQANAPSEEGRIEGAVRDALTGDFITGVQVSVWIGTTKVADASTGGSGSYWLSVPPGSNYWLLLEKGGYIAIAYEEVIVQQNMTTFLETLMQIDETHSGIGSVGGTITDATTGLGADGVLVSLRHGANSRRGPVIATATTSGGGNYRIDDLHAGNWTLEASKNGFITGYCHIYCIGQIYTPHQNCTISPSLPSNKMRFVLSWGDAPPDVDLHLTGPLPTGERFHMYWYYAEACPDHGNCWHSPWPSYVVQDIDEINGYGPETITLNQVLPGMYRVSVHDYSNRSLTESSALTDSGASVQVYKGNALVGIFYVPPGEPGTLWTVFEMEGDTITPVNTFSYKYSTATIPAPESCGHPGSDAGIILEGNICK